MIEINLLPPNLRVKKKESAKLPSLPSLPIIPIAAGIVAFLVFLQVLLLFFIQTKAMCLDSIKKKITSISNSNKEVMDIDSRLKEISSKAEIIDKLAASRFCVARKLNELSDSMIQGVWLRNIDIRKSEPAGETGVSKELLLIEGSDIVLGDNKEGAIGKFVNSLKENESFASDFDNIEIAKEELKKVRDTEIMDFVIICHFKKGKGL